MGSLPSLESCPSCGGPLLPGTPEVCPRCAAGALFGGADDLFSDDPLPEPKKAESRLRYFGNYVLEEEIARGGMGIVYRARQDSLGREVAVKVLRDAAFAGGQEIERFRTEAAAAAALKHPHIVGIHEIGEHDGQHFFSMDFIPGPTLAHLLRDGPLPPLKAARWMQSIAAAIAHAHAQGVLHRDLKPSNVLIDGAGQPQVTDFGLARREGSDSALTLSGQVLGTPAYMAPEQARGRNREIGPLSDVYGLGALLYHLISGRQPFTGESHVSVLSQVVHDEPVAPRVLHPGIPRDLETVCLKAMAKDAPRRYANARAMADDLGRFIDGLPVAARPISSLERGWRWARRHRALAASLAAVFILTLGVAVVSTIYAQRLNKARADEANERGRAEGNAAEARLNLYTSDMKVALQNWNEGYLRAASVMLSGHQPVGGGPDVRGFEWHYLHHLLQGEQEERLPISYCNEGAITSDGRYALVVADGNAMVIDTGKAKMLMKWTEPDIRYISSYRRLDRHPSRRLLACSGVTGLRLLDLDKDTNEVIDKRGCESVAFSPDGRWLAACSRQAYGSENEPPHWVRIWDLDTRTVVKELSMDGRGLAWTDLNELIVIDAPGTTQARLSWILPEQAEPLRQFPFTKGKSFVYFAWLHPASDHALMLMGDTGMLFIRLSTGEVLHTLPGQRMIMAAFSADGSRFALSGSEQAVRIRDVSSWEEFPPLRGHDDRVAALAFDADGKRLRSIANDSTLRVWDAGREESRPLYALDYSDWFLWSPVLSPDGNRAALLVNAGIMGDKRSTEAVLWDRTARRETGRIPDIPLAFSPDGNALLTLHKWECFRVIDSFSGDERLRFTLPVMPQKAAPRVSPDGRWIAYPSRHEHTIVYELATGRQVFELNTGLGSPSFSPDSRWLATCEGRTLMLHDLISGSTVATGKRATSLLAWSQDSRQIAVRNEHYFKIVDAAPGGTERQLAGHRGPIGAMAFSADGRTIVTGGEDNTLRFWNIATGREALALPVPGRTDILGFTPDGSCLLHGGGYGYGFVAAPGAARPAPSQTACGWMERIGSLPPPPKAPPAAGSAAEDDAVRTRLRVLWEACGKWRAQHGDWPEYLSQLGDLLPEPRSKALLSPQAERSGKIVTLTNYMDPVGPTSFVYHWSTAERPPPWPEWYKGTRLSQREFHEHFREKYGDATPLIRCWDIERDGKHPAVLCDGTVCLVPPDWKDAYEKGWRPEKW